MRFIHKIPPCSVLVVSEEVCRESRRGMEVRAVSRAAWAQWAVLLALTVPAVCKVRKCHRLLHSGHGAVLPSMYKWMRGIFDLFKIKSEANYLY